MSEYKPKALERSGFSALYTFTPFKILKLHQDKYLIQLTNICNFKVYPKGLKWCRGISEEPIMKTKRRGPSVRIIVPIELLAITFKPNGERYVYVRYDKEIDEKIRDVSLQEHILALTDSNLFKKNIPIYLELSYQALQEPRVCRLGFVILSSSSSCPLESSCPRIRIDESGKCKYYVKVNNTYAGLYHVYPWIEKRFNVMHEEDIEYITIIPFNGLPLIKVGFTKKGEVIGYINLITFIPKRSWLFYSSRFYLYPNPTIGIKLKNVHALIFEFDTEYLMNIIVNSLLTNELIYRWLALKYIFGRRILTSKQKLYRVVDGFKGSDELSRIFEYIARGENDRIKSLIDELTVNKGLFNDDDFINFVSFVLIHTFAHIIMTAISAKYNVPEEALIYYIDHPILQGRDFREGYIRLVIFEDAIGGYGYIKNIVSNIKEQRNLQLFQDLFKSSMELLERDDELIKDSLRTFKDNVSTLINKINVKLRDIIRSRIENIWSFIDKVGVYPHIIALRRSILSDVELEDIDEYSRNILEEVFSNAPLCWDGCPHCIVLEKGCTYTPYDQIFVVSKSLIKEFIKTLTKSLERPYSSIYFTKVKDYVNELIDRANYELLISTASLSTITMDSLSSMLSRKHNLKVRILAYTGSISDSRILEKIKEVSHKYKNFEIRLHEKLHAKGILVDNLILLKGSFNFTMKGLEVNVENIDIVYQLDEIAKFKEGFERIWREAKPPK